MQILSGLLFAGTLKSHPCQGEPPEAFPWPVVPLKPPPGIVSLPANGAPQALVPTPLFSPWGHGVAATARSCLGTCWLGCRCSRWICQDTGHLAARPGRPQLAPHLLSSSMGSVKKRSFGECQALTATGGWGPCGTACSCWPYRAPSCSGVACWLGPPRVAGHCLGASSIIPTSAIVPTWPPSKWQSERGPGGVQHGGESGMGVPPLDTCTTKSPHSVAKSTKKQKTCIKIFFNKHV